MNGQPRQSLKRDLELVAWNTNGLASRHSELLEFVARHKPDVLLLGETHPVSYTHLKVNSGCSLACCFEQYTIGADTFLTCILSLVIMATLGPPSL